MAGPTTGTQITSTGRALIIEQQGNRVFPSPATTGTVILGEQNLPSGAIRFWGYLSESLETVGASDTTTALLPAGTLRVDVAIRVTTTLSGNSVANYDVGVTGSATLGVSNYTNITAGDTCVCQMTLTPALNAAAVGILITPDQTTTAGAMRITAWFEGIRASTS